MQKIAIEQNLTPVMEFLNDKGYKVESISFNKEYTKQADKYDAFIVSGQNPNFLGVQDTNTRAVIINAAGLSPEQIYHELRLRLD